MRRNLALVVALALVVVGLLAWKTRGFGLVGDAPGGGAVRPDESPGEVAGGARLDAGMNAADAAADPKTYEGDRVGVVEAGLGAAAVAGSVTGHGAPIRFARVVVVMAPPNDGVAVRTTKEGKFEIRGLPVEAFDLRASADGWRPRTVTTMPLVEGKTTDAGEIALKPAEPLKDGLEVKVVDGSGRPVAAARVDVTTLGYGLYASMGAARAGITDVVSRDGLTDERGVARFFPLPAEKYDVLVRATGYAVEAVPNVQAAAGRVEHVKVTLEPGLSIAGTVVDSTGAPVAKAHVVGLLLPAFRTYPPATTAGDGTFSLDGLAPGPYWIFSFHDDKGQGQETKVKAGDRGVRLTLAGVGKLVGRVTVAGGAPASSFLLRPYDPSYYGYVYSHAITIKDPDGKYELVLPPGNYQVDAKSEGGAFVSGPKTTVKVGETSTLDIVLPAFGLVRGVVAGPDGQHVAGAEVYVNKQGFPPGPVREEYAKTDAEGQFVISGLPLQPVGLHVRHQGFAETVFEATPEPGDRAKAVTVRLTLGARVVGHVLTPSLQPVVGAQVNLLNGFDFFGGKTVQTDANGAYAFAGVAKGTYAVNVGRFENDAPGPRRGGVEVPAEGDVVVDFTTEHDESATGTVTGRVTVGGAPVSGASVTATDDRGEDAAVHVKTDAEGRYTATGLKAGRVTVSVSNGGTETERRARIEPAGATATLDVALGTSRLFGKVVGADGRTAISGAWVSLEDAGPASEGGWKGWSQTDGSGAFSVTGLEPATLRLRVSGSAGYAARVTSPFSLAEGEQKDLGLVKLEAGGGITGRVTDDRGSPVEGVGVSLKNARGEAVFLFSIGTSGSDGRYAVESVEIGTYSVRFQGKGYAPLDKTVEVTAAGATVDAVMPRGGSVTARVENEQGEPVDAARIELYDAKGQRLSKTLTLANLFDADVTRTGESGSTTIPDLAPGAYTVKAKKDGLTLVGDAPVATVASGANVSVRLVLRAGP